MSDWWTWDIKIIITSWLYRRHVPMKLYELNPMCDLIHRNEIKEFITHTDIYVYTHICTRLPDYSPISFSLPFV
jgi:hypothetical protein